MNVPKFKPISRRAVLRGIGGITLALPFLEAMRPRRVLADQPPPRRWMLVWYVPLGTSMDDWSPRNALWNPDVVGPPTSQGPGRFGVGSHLVGETGFELGPIMKPMERHKNDMLIVQGVHMSYAHAHTYGPPCTLTGSEPMRVTDDYYTASGPSIDQHIVKSLDLANVTKIPSLHIGINLEYKSCISWRGAGDGVLGQGNPYEIFKQLFGEFTGNPIDPAVLQRLRATRASILDSVGANAGTFMSRLGTEDRRRMDQYLEAVRQLEKNLADGKGGICTPPDMGTTQIDWTANDNVPAVGKLMMDMSVMALACDLTRVIVMGWGDEGTGAYSHTWIPGGEGGWHGVTHDTTDGGLAARRGLTKIWTWYHEQLAGMVDSMKTFTQPDGKTLLDEGVIFTTSSFGPGSQDDPASHRAIRAPYTLIGSCGGYFKTGRNVFCGGPVTAEDGSSFGDGTRPWSNQMFVSLMNAMGVQGDRFGRSVVSNGIDPDIDIPPGPIPRLTG